MPSCPHASSCALSRNISMREALRVWQSFYCEGAFVRCERYKLATLGRAIPDKLLPNGRLQDTEEVPAPVSAAGGRRR
ncbi:MAG TPA: hypothetical protein VFL83_06390 [Anaeromyxobacter sp.]|nr:hypothetical protein [Anaeromyxobacter sp.]